MTYVNATICDLAKQATPFTGEFLVDTGSIDCLAPASNLVEAGITPEGTSLYELASGDEVEYEYGFARLQLEDAETVVQVVFGPEQSSPIVGVVALENMGLAVDPVTKTLKRLQSKPLK